MEKIEEYSTKKIFTYRGKTIEELKQLEIREFAKLTKSRTRRFLLNRFQEIEDFLNRSRKKIENGKSVKTHKRYFVVVPQMVGMNIQIHNGKEFVPVKVTEEMLGHRFGEFSLTRSKVSHGAAGIGATKGSKGAKK